MAALPELSEAEFMRRVIQLARLLGFAVYHTHDSRRSDAGFPDLVLVKPPRVIFAELKSAKGKVRPEQQHWLELLEGCHLIGAYLWRPDDLQMIANILGGA